jgi:hypothetical protein
MFALARPIPIPESPMQTLPPAPESGAIPRLPSAARDATRRRCTARDLVAWLKRRAARPARFLCSSVPTVAVLAVAVSAPLSAAAGAKVLAADVSASGLLAQNAQELPSIEDHTEGMAGQEGFLPVYWDAAGGRIWLEIPALDQELLYVESLPAGVGSNDIGLDRGQLGGEAVVRFERVGRRVLMVQPNYDFRAETENAAERRAVRDAFATSVLWGFEVAAEEDGRVLVDATDFVLRDAHDVVGTLQRTGQGSYRLERSRSVPHLRNVRAFPDNTELEATLTFVGEDPGGWVRSVTPTPQAVTVRQRHSFVRLPPPGYRPRPTDRRGCRWRKLPSYQLVRDQTRATTRRCLSWLDTRPSR